MSLETAETIDRISRILREIGHRLMILNDISQEISDYTQYKPEAVEINREIVILWLNIIMIFRTQARGKSIRKSNHSAQWLKPFRYTRSYSLGNARRNL